MAHFSISLSGTKAEAKDQAERQVKNQDCLVALGLIIDQAPGTKLSLSGSMASSTDGSHGSLSLNGSFWS